MYLFKKMIKFKRMVQIKKSRMKSSSLQYTYIKRFIIKTIYG